MTTSVTAKTALLGPRPEDLGVAAIGWLPDPLTWMIVASFLAEVGNGDCLELLAREAETITCSELNDLLNSFESSSASGALIGRVKTRLAEICVIIMLVARDIPLTEGGQI